MAELRHLNTAWDVDRHIVLESERVVLIRFSKFESPPTSSSTTTTNSAVHEEHHISTQLMDEMLVSVAVRTRKFCAVFAVDTQEVREFDAMYELAGDEDPFAIMFFYRGQHIRVDVGTGNYNKINFVMEEEDLIPIIESVYRAGVSNKKICSSEKKFSFAAVKR